MARVVYFTRESPSKLGTELAQAGHQVWEAIALSEVLYLIEHEDIDIVVIAPEVEDPEMVTAQVRRTCITLQPGYRVQDLCWDLAALSGGTISPTVQ